MRKLDPWEWVIADHAVKSSTAIQRKQPTAALIEPERDTLQDDPRWALAQRVAAGTHFARSTLLSSFLLYIVSETLAGREKAISEHKIGVAVFGRPLTYRTDDDNIVRNYARQLRKRLAEHFAGIGNEEPVRIDIPIGGYVPAFVEAPPARSVASAEQSLPSLAPVASDAKGNQVAGGAWRRAALILGVVVVVVALGLLAIAGWVSRHHDPAPNRALWSALFAGPGNTYIVPPDAGFNLLEDMAHRSYPLSSYIKGTFADTSDGRLNSHTDRDIRTQQYTDFLSTEIVALLARQPEYDPQRVLLRFPRDLRVGDLKTGNALIIGSVSSNPWAGLVGAPANFHIVPSDDMESAQIVNDRPLRSESPTYSSHWNEPAHETYALILFLPNLSGSGHVLSIEGLDVAGTQAAAELLFHPDSILPILKSARRSDGSLRSFEILLRASSIESNAAGTQIIASRVH